MACLNSLAIQHLAHHESIQNNKKSIVFDGFIFHDASKYSGFDGLHAFHLVAISPPIVQQQKSLNTFSLFNNKVKC